VALFLVIVTGYLGSLWRAWRRLNQAVFRTVAKHGIAPRLEALLLGLAAATIGVMVGGFLDHYLFNLVYPHMSALFWIYVGLGMSATRIARAA
jgi:hypothetical protein